MRLRHLLIKGFRGFTNFNVRGLGQVNLIIGRNNSGKTSLLEAVYLLEAVGGDPFVAICRDEDVPSRYLDLFNGRPSANSNGRIQIGCGMADHELKMEFSQGMFDVQRPSSLGAPLRCRVGEALPQMMPASSPLMMGPGTSTPLNVAHLWDRILFTPYHDDVKTCLKLVVPDLVDVALSPTNRKPIVRLADTPAPISMASMGDGVTRLFQLACGLVVSKGTVFLVDEIENGVHHSVHGEMWAFIFRIARTHDVQVFATTHSLDCLRGFAWASHQIPEVEARVVRLDNHNGQVEPVMFDEEEFQIAAEEEIEIR